jgi:hypothetical protein
MYCASAAAAARVCAVDAQRHKGGWKEVRAVGSVFVRVVRAYVCGCVKAPRR